MKSFLATTALTFLGLSGLSRAAYSLTDTYNAGNFFSKFNFYTGNDPTHGFVNYVDQGTAQNGGLINTNNNQIYIGVDHTTVNPGGRGRNSVRLESKTQYTHGLFILDMNHMPGSVCGTWPAFWTYGPNWPNSGEIDILEGVNSQNADFITLHTGGTCKAGTSGFSGQLTTSDCNENTGGSSGCSIHSSNTQTYGDGMNSNGGGVYAMEWTSQTIKVWFFGRNNGQIPSDISSGKPNPNNWGTPIANFPGGASCNIDSNFANHWIVFDNTFCGDWAGAAFGSDPNCSNKGSCQNWVAGNPGAFAPSYWSINSLKVYSGSAGSKRDVETVDAEHLDVVDTTAAAVTPAHNDSTAVSDAPAPVAAVAAAASGHAMSPNGLPGSFTEEMRKAFLVPGVQKRHENHMHVARHAHAHGRVEKHF